jgi:hypothetical protein
MQAASLFALAARKRLQIGVVAQVTNALNGAGESFCKGPEDTDERLLHAVCKAAQAIVGR